MSRSHGLAGEFGAQAWAAPARTPLYYPDAVTLVPGADRADLVARIDIAAPGECATSSDLAWTVVGTPDALADWALAWDDEGGDADLFRPALLDHPITFVLAGLSEGGRVVAGAVANRSDPWARCGSGCTGSKSRPSRPDPVTASERGDRARSVAAPGAGPRSR